MDLDQSKQSYDTNPENTPKTWIHAYQSISGQKFNMDIVMKTIGQISIEEETIMNTTINDSMMVPIMPFERQIFEMVDAETGDLFSVDKIPSFLNFIKEEHSLTERMMLLEVIQSFSKVRYIRKLYKEGLLDVLRPWVSFEPTPEAEALTEATLTFLLSVKLTKKIISNYSFNIGKAIVRVKKNGSETNKKLAEKVQTHWTEILSAEEKPEPSSQNELVVLPPYSVESLISSDSVALHTRSRGQAIYEPFDRRKRLREEDVYTEEDKQKTLWSLRIRRLDRRNKFNIRRHQSNHRCNIKLTIRLDYTADCAYIRTPRSDVLTESMEGFTPSTNPDVIDYVSFYAGSYIRDLHHFPNPYIVPDELSTTPAVRVDVDSSHHVGNAFVSSRYRQGVGVSGHGLLWARY